MPGAISPQVSFTPWTISPCTQAMIRTGVPAGTVPMIADAVLGAARMSGPPGGTAFDPLAEQIVALLNSLDVMIADRHR